MRIHKSGEKSVEFFVAYMKLLVLSEKASMETIEQHMIANFFQHDVHSLGPITHANFTKALWQLQNS